MIYHAVNRSFVRLSLLLFLCFGLQIGTVSASQAQGFTPGPVITRPIVAAPSQAFNSFNNLVTTQSTVASGTYRKRYVCTADAADPELVFGNQVNEFNQLPLPVLAPIQVRASIEYPLGSPRRPLTFFGQRTALIEPNGIVHTDAIGLDLRKGDAFYVWVYVAGSIWPNGPQLVQNAPFYEGFTPNTDETATANPITPASPFGYMPLFVLGTPAHHHYTPVIAILGDSVAGGQQDSINRGGINQNDLGYIVRALAPGGIPGLNDQYGYVRCSKPGEPGQVFALTDYHTQRLRLLNGCTHAICEYGLNDFKNNHTFAQMKGDFLTLWHLLACRSLRVYQTTVTPFTYSSDGWASVSGQSIPVAASEAVRVAFNTWLRDPSPEGAVFQSGGDLKGIFEAADLAETARNSGLWRPYYCSDGLHPSNFGAPFLAAAINLSVFQPPSVLGSGEMRPRAAGGATE